MEYRSLLLSGMLLGFTGCGEDTDSKADTGGDPVVVDTNDTAVEIEPVWEQAVIETAITLNGVYASGRGVYAVGTEGSLFRYTVATSWEAMDVDADGEDLNGLWGAGREDTLELVAVGNAGMVVTADYDTSSTEDLGTNNFESISGPDSASLIAVGWGGVYAKGLSGWEYEALPTSDRLNHVWANSTTAYGVGEEGVIYKRTAGTWAAMESPTSKNLYGVSGSADNDVWAVGADGVILHYDGSTWEEQGSPTSQTLWAVWAYSAVSVYAVGSNGTAIMWSGDGWTDLPTGVTHNLYALHGSGQDDCWVVGNRGMGLHYSGGR